MSRRGIAALLALACSSAAAVATAADPGPGARSKPRQQFSVLATSAKSSRKDVNLEGMFESWEGQHHDWGSAWRKKHGGHHDSSKNTIGFLHDPVEEASEVGKWETHVQTALASVGLSAAAAASAVKEEEGAAPQRKGPMSADRVLAFVRGTELSPNCSTRLTEALMMGSPKEKQLMTEFELPVSSVISRCLRSPAGQGGSRCRSEAEIWGRSSRSAALKVKGAGCLPRACAGNQVDMQALAAFLRQESEKSVDGAADVRVRLSCSEGGGRDAVAPALSAAAKGGGLPTVFLLFGGLLSGL